MRAYRLEHALVVLICNTVSQREIQCVVFAFPNSNILEVTRVQLLLRQGNGKYLLEALRFQGSTRHTCGN